MSGTAANIVGALTSIGATAAAKKAADATWKLGAGKQPPTDPTDPETQLREALLWAVLSGAAVGVARMFVMRQMTKRERHRARAAL